LIVCPAKNQKEYDEAADKTLSKKLWLQLVQCYTFADSIQSPRFQDAVMEEILCMVELRYHEGESLNLLLYTDPTSVSAVYQKTTGNSRLQQLLVTLFIHHRSMGPWKGLMDDYMENCGEFILDVLAAAMDQARQGNHISPPWEEPWLYRDELD
jgi:hypothetical protein